MDKERNIDRLAGWLIKLGVFAAVAFLCWYFRSVLVYVIIAFVVSLIGQPIVRLLKRIRIKGHSLPSSLLAILTILLLLALLSLVVTQIVPVVSGIVRDASAMNSANAPDIGLVDRFNDWLIGLFPSLGADFDVVSFILAQLKEVTNVSNVSSVIGSVASVTAKVAVGLFSVVFISFFFIKDGDLFTNIIRAIVPDKMEDSVAQTVKDIEHLLSRYFIGLIIEVIGVILVDFLGLWLIARIGVNYAIGIAFIAGLLNVIPYVGPLLGELIGVVLCVVLKYGAGIGLNVDIWVFALIVLAIMLTAQLIDNFIYQPLIYSTSIKSTPLEIFIVLLMAGTIGGTVGLLVGIPAYTVIRVIAIRFFSDRKVVRRLIPDLEKENVSPLV